MTRWPTAVAIALALAAPGLASAEDRREQSARDWDAKALTRIQVENPRGEIAVRPSHDGRVHLVALKILRHADRHGAEAFARDTRVEAEIRSGALHLVVLYPQRHEIRLDVWDLVKGVEIPEVEVRLALEVPPALALDLESASGDLLTSGVAGRQELTAASGDVEVSESTAAVNVSTRSGDATLTDVGAAAVSTSSGTVVIGAARGSVTVSTRSGDVRIDSSTDSVTVGTASGEVRVGLARSGLDVVTSNGDVIARGGGRVRIRTASGEAKVALIAPLSHAEVRTASGDISVRVAPGIECDLDADAGSGEVAVDLPLDVRTAKHNHIAGRLGRGTTGIVIHSTSGSVNVAR